MGGNSGGIIVRQAAKQALSDPTVHGNLPAHTKTILDPILAKDEGDWSPAECKSVADAIHWAICHLA